MKPLIPRVEKWCCCKTFRGSSPEVLTVSRRFIIKRFDYDIAVISVEK